jgi:hypothetical protein
MIVILNLDECHPEFISGSISDSYQVNGFGAHFDLAQCGRRPEQPDICGYFYYKPSVITSYETSAYLWSLGLCVLVSPSKSF